MEVSALKYSGGIGLHGRSPLLRLQSDERLIAFLRKGNTAAFDVLVARYETRLLAFCRHLLGSREDAEDVLQEVMTAAFNAILADERPINVRPWLYRIARNRSLNHMRRIQAIGVDSMDHHFSENGASTADKVHQREEFRLLVGDIHELPETQKTALVLREMDALTYEQIAEAMETTIPSVKSLLVRARVSLAEAAEARLLSCDEVRIELAEVAEGLQRRPSPLVRRHLRECKRCTVFRGQLRQTNKALAALLPVGPLVVFRKLLFLHLGHSAGAGSGATAAGSGAGAAGAGAASAGAAGTTALAGSSGLVSAGIGALAGKAAAGLAAAALVTAGAVEADHSAVRHHAHRTPVAAAAVVRAPAQAASVAPVTSYPERRSSLRNDVKRRVKPAASKQTAPVTTKAVAKPATTLVASTATPTATSTAPAGRTQTQSDPTVLPPSATAPAAPVAPVITPTTTQTTPTATAPTATPTPTGTSTSPTATPTTPTTTTTSPTTTSTTPTTTTPTTPTTTTPTTTTPTTTTTSTTPPPTSGNTITSSAALGSVALAQLDGVVQSRS
jgi:RNA polymerase sigma factor (sigma-70 family)